MSNKLKFSIIIPSYNEKEDIRLSIESAINQTYQNKEILLLMIQAIIPLKLLRNMKNSRWEIDKRAKKGCCGARNLGMKIATDDVIVLLNGDVRLPSDFWEKILKHYEVGADYVLVEAKAFNLESLWARFIEMQHRYERKKIGQKAEWTEGFSCRRQAAISIGLIPGDLKARFCRDWFFWQKIRRSGI